MEFDSVSKIQLVLLAREALHVKIVHLRSQLECGVMNQSLSRTKALLNMYLNQYDELTDLLLLTVILMMRGNKHGF